MIGLEAIKARADAATPGPWVVIGAIVSDGSRGLEDRVRNAEFCAHARTDVPALVAEVERLRSLNGAESVVAMWSPCCRIIRAGEWDERTMHNGVCRAAHHGGVLGPTIRLVAHPDDEAR